MELGGWWLGEEIAHNGSMRSGLGSPTHIKKEKSPIWQNNVYNPSLWAAWEGVGAEGWVGDGGQRQEHLWGLLLSQSGQSESSTSVTDLVSKKREKW